MNRGVALWVGVALLLAASPAFSQTPTPDPKSAPKVTPNTKPLVVTPPVNVKPIQTLPTTTNVKPCVGPNCPPAPSKSSSTSTASSTPSKTPGSSSGSGASGAKTPAAALTLPYRTTTAEMAFVGRAGETPAPLPHHDPVRLTTGELAFTGRAGETPPPIPHHDPVRITTGELAFIGPH